MNSCSFIRSMITQMKQELDEAGIANHPNNSSKEENDAKLQEVQKEILTQRTQLENVEKQLADFYWKQSVVINKPHKINSEHLISSLRNSSPEPLFQNLPFTTLLQQGLGNPFFLAENELNFGPEVGGYMNPPTPTTFDANLLPPSMDNISQQAMATSGEGYGKRGLP
ncbi:jagged 1-like protein [Corchorus capsularis]|uniref:Jagged 1-like protein n=1 Tax=Corchorus capsularis TaxID=210143 RepID=A0A1R3GEP7_COCAP|nr:jagged 1-like protein [Corchorus capsularis]